MNISNIISLIAITAPLIVSLLLFSFWLGRKIIGIELNQNMIRDDLKNYIKLFFNDERLAFEKRFDEIEKIASELKTEIQSNRHRLNNLEPQVKFLSDKYLESK